MTLPKTERKYQLLTRLDSKSSDSYGKDPYKRTIPELLDYGFIEKQAERYLISDPMMLKAIKE